MPVQISSDAQPEPQQQPSLTDYEFINRVAAYPLVNKSIEIFEQKVVPVVEANPLTKYAADTAVKVASAVATPVLKTVQPYQNTVDSLGNKAVDMAEGVIQTGVSVISAGTKVADTVLLSPLEKAVNGVDRVVDWALPPTEKELKAADNQEFVDAAADESFDSLDSNGVVLPRPAPFKRAYEVTAKAASRAINVVSTRGQKAYAETEEYFHLRSTLEILGQYQSQLEASSKKLRDTIASTQAYLQETVTDREKLSQSLTDAKEFGMEKIAKPTFDSVLAVQNRLIESLADVRSSVNHSIDLVRKRLPSLPFNVQENLNALVTKASKRWEETLKKVNEHSASSGEVVSFYCFYLLFNL
jgi:hypothetical protein